MTGEQLRHLLSAANWTPRDLARRSNLGERVIARALQAQGEVPITIAHQRAIMAAVEDAGFRHLLFSKHSVRNSMQTGAKSTEEREAQGRGLKRTRKKASASSQAGLDVLSIRNSLAMTQAEFASTFGFPLSAIQMWESDPSAIKPAARAYLHEIASNADDVKLIVQRSVQSLGKGSEADRSETGHEVIRTES